MTVSKAKSGIFYGWWVLLLLSLSHFYNAGSFMNGFTAFFNPIIDEFGWTYALVSLAVSFRGLESGLVAPIAGVLVDKFGPKAMILFGTAVMGVGFLFFSHVNNLTTFYAASVVIAIGSSFNSGVATFPAIAGWFKRRTTLAMGLLTAAWGAGGLMVPILVSLIDRFSWRTVLLGISFGTFLLIVPMALGVKNPPRDVPSLKQPTDSEVRASPDGLTTRETLRTREFWLLCAIVLFGNLSGLAILSHQIPYLVSIGISRESAGFTVIIFSLGNIAGRLGLGWLGDILGNRWCLLVAVLTQVTGTFIFAVATSVPQFIPALILLGIGFGGMVPLRPAIQRELFGIKAFGTIGGLFMAFGTLGGIISPVFAGWMYDVGRNYRLAWIILATVTLTTVPLILAIRKSTSAGFEPQAKL
ncbi:MAG: MFS transporter [Chloroflexota bacterium]